MLTFLMLTSLTFLSSQAGPVKTGPILVWFSFFFTFVLVCTFYMTITNNKHLYGTFPQQISKCFGKEINSISSALKKGNHKW